MRADNPHVLLTWEMGGGLGHLVRLGRIAQRLEERGARLTMVSRDPLASQRWFPHAPCVQAPLQHTRLPAYPNAATLAEVMDNMGLGQTDSLEALVASWLTLFEHLLPDVLVMDFSPGALLAAQTTSARRILIDNGYSHPPREGFMPSLRPWQRSYDDLHHGVEERVRLAANGWLELRGQPPLDQLCELFDRVDAVHLMTLPELDHTGFKPDRDYRGYLSSGGQRGRWPEDGKRRPRLLVMLRPIRGLGERLERLAEAGFSVLACVPGLTEYGNGPLPMHPQLAWSSDWLDVRRSAQDADVVLCAGGDSVGISLLAGKPVAVVPFFAEQYLTALRAVETGAARLLLPEAPVSEWLDCLRTLVENDDFSSSARQLAERHADLDPEAQLEAIVDSILRSGSPTGR